MAYNDKQWKKRLPGARLIQTSYGEKRYGILIHLDDPGISDRGDVVWLGTVLDDSDPDMVQWTFNGLPKVERSVWLKNLTYKGADKDQWLEIAIDAWKDAEKVRLEREMEAKAKRFETARAKHNAQEFQQLIKDLTALSRIDPEA